MVKPPSKTQKHEVDSSLRTPPTAVLPTTLENVRQVMHDQILTEHTSRKPKAKKLK